MSIKLIASPKPTMPGRNKTEEIGGCVVCKQGIFSDQEWGRAPRPLIGKAHEWCAAEAAEAEEVRRQILAEQFPPVAELEAERRRGEPLTRRELEILSFVGCGLTKRQIADRLWVAASTVETHLDHARLKLGVHTNLEAARAALDAGLIPAGAVMSR